MSDRHSASSGVVWPWPARIPPIILAYGGSVLAALAFERIMHSAMSASYAAIAVVPGGLAAGIAAFALSFAPRRRLLILAATVIVALLPLGVIALSFDFQQYRPIFEERAWRLGLLFAALVALATSVLIAAGVLPAQRRGART